MRPTTRSMAASNLAKTDVPPLSFTAGRCFPSSFSQAATITALHHFQQQLFRATHTMLNMQREIDTLKRQLALSAKATTNTTNQTNSASATATPSKSPDATLNKPLVGQCRHAGPWTHFSPARTLQHGGPALQQGCHATRTALHSNRATPQRSSRRATHAQDTRPVATSGHADSTSPFTFVSVWQNSGLPQALPASWSATRWFVPSSRTWCSLGVKDKTLASLA